MCWWHQAGRSTTSAYHLRGWTPPTGRLSGLGPGECQISLSQVGLSRAKLLDLRGSDPAPVLTQYVRHANRPCYLAECPTARAGHR